ncbi:5-aminolevulinate synthase, nonspecific, mitochondrial-like protein [Sarcoptes scabiei]|uniref:5-aminolevulinate synthase n=1 Tax=Sarcoptes scabiei TaxID=52283 RepID=A0A132AG10_SARSC|nr:5-aminolevulinate synthase, nonspecific, mitochondrial-like protein [Sarcoptes scabiei]
MSLASTKCPFLSKFSYQFLNRYSTTILYNYITKCPYVSKRLFSDQNRSTEVSNQAENLGSSAPIHTDGDVSRCPFYDTLKLSFCEASDQVVNDILEVKNPKKRFPYDKFFDEQILRKKQDYSYRIFKKVARDAKNYPFAKEFSDEAEDKMIKVWCSNDYLGITAHPKVQEAIIEAVKKFGSGSGGTRNISGNTPCHYELENELASLHQKESALLFTSCYVANDSTLYTLGKLLPGCHIFSDSDNHASMIQGIRNSGAPKHIFKTCDPIHLEELLKQVDYSSPKIVAFETGTLHRLKSCVMLHIIHAVGLYGDNGAGVGQRDNVLHKMDIISGTLGKAFGNVGGYIAGSKSLVDMIRSYAAGFIFTTSLPPTVLKGAITAIKILQGEEGQMLREMHQRKVQYFKKRLRMKGIPQLKSKSHIIPIPIGNAFLCNWICNELLDKYGHYVQAINYPTVRKGEERLRLAPSPLHSYEMIDQFVDEFVQVYRNSGLRLTTEHDHLTCSRCEKLWAAHHIDHNPCGERDLCPVFAKC